MDEVSQKEKDFEYIQKAFDLDLESKIQIFNLVKKYKLCDRVSLGIIIFNLISVVILLIKYGDAKVSNFVDFLVFGAIVLLIAVILLPESEQQKIIKQTNEHILSELKSE